MASASLETRRFQDQIMQTIPMGWARRPAVPLGDPGLPTGGPLASGRAGDALGARRSRASGVFCGWDGREVYCGCMACYGVHHGSVSVLIS